MSTTAFLGHSKNTPRPHAGFMPQLSDWLNMDLPDLRARGVTQARCILKLIDYRTNGNISPLRNPFFAKCQQARDRGVGLIIRPSYNHPKNGWGDDGIDARIDFVEQHIAYIGEWMRDNEDVIDWTEAGYAGRWAEWHSSTNGLIGGTTSHPEWPQDGDHIVNANTDRIIAAIKRHYPAGMRVAIRYLGPLIAYTGYATKLTAANAHDGSWLARVGVTNDFIGSGRGSTNQSYHDGGFFSYDPASGLVNGYYPESGRYGDEVRHQENRKDWAVFGSEFDPNSRNDGPRMAATRWREEEGRRFGYGSLRERNGYSDHILERWRSEGQYDAIGRELGYRYRLVSATAPDAIQPGGDFTVAMKVVNDGYQPCQFGHLNNVVLRPVGGGTLRRLAAPMVRGTLTDCRQWRPRAYKKPGQATPPDLVHDVQLTVRAPADLPAGNYQVLFELPYVLRPSDPKKSIPLMSTRRVGTEDVDIFDPATGLNDLGLTIAASGTAAPTVPAAPTGVVGTPGNAQGSIAFTAPAGGGVLEYEAEAVAVPVSGGSPAVGHALQAAGTTLQWAIAGLETPPVAGTTLLFAAQASNGGQVATAPTGSQRVYDIVSAQARLVVYALRVTDPAQLPASFSMAFTTAGEHCGFMVALHGLDANLLAGTNAVYTGTPTGPELRVPAGAVADVAGATAVSVVCNRQGDADNLGAWGAPAGWTKLGDINTGPDIDSRSIAVAVNTAARPAGADLGEVSWINQTGLVNDDSIGVAFLLRPQGAVGPGPTDPPVQSPVIAQLTVPPETTTSATQAFTAQISGDVDVLQVRLDRGEWVNVNVPAVLPATVALASYIDLEGSPEGFLHTFDVRAIRDPTGAAETVTATRSWLVLEAAPAPAPEPVITRVPIDDIALRATADALIPTPHAVIEVRTAGGSQAVVYADDTGDTRLPNPQIADGFGRYVGWVDDQLDHDIIIRVPGLQPVVRRLSAGGGGGGGVTDSTGLVQLGQDAEGNPVIDVRTKYGIDEQGEPYFNPDGATPGEEAFLTVNASGQFVLIKIGG